MGLNGWNFHSVYISINSIFDFGTIEYTKNYVTLEMERYFS